MAKQGVTKIDIKQVLAQKAPKASRKIPGFIVDYLIRTVHQEELNDILTRYHDKEGGDFMRELIGYFDLTLDLVHAENIPTEGRLQPSARRIGRYLSLRRYRFPVRRPHQVSGQ